MKSSLVTSPTMTLPVPLPTTAVVQGHHATYLGALHGTRKYPDSGMTFGAPIGDIKSLDWIRAFQSCFDGPVGCVTTGNATVALASATGPSGYPSPSGNLFDHANVFLVTWAPGPCFKLSAPSCRDVYIIDVKTYGNTYGFELASTAPVPGAT